MLTLKKKNLTRLARVHKFLGVLQHEPVSIGGNPKFHVCYGDRT